MFGAAPTWAADLSLQVLALDGQALHDEQGLATQRYDARPGTAYLLRPDGHVAARWREPTAAGIQAAIDRALARS